MENDVICSGDLLLGKMVEATIESARNGDTESARKILGWFCGAIDGNTDKSGNPFRTPSGTGTQIDERILRYLAGCFKEILNDRPGARLDANHALGLVAPGKRGNKKTRASRERSLDMGYQVMERYEQIKNEAKPEGMSRLDKAINDVAKNHRTSYQTVKDAYDEWNKTKKKAIEEMKSMGK